MIGCLHSAREMSMAWRMKAVSPSAECKYKIAFHYWNTIWLLPRPKGSLVTDSETLNTITNTNNHDVVNRIMS